MPQGLTLYHAEANCLGQLAPKEDLPSVPLDVFHQAGKKLVYLGGNQNCLGMLHSFKFPEVLTAYQSFKPAQSPLSYFSVALGDKADEKDFLNEHTDIYQTFFRIGMLHPSSYVQRLIDELFLPDDLVDRWRKSPDPYPAMQDYFSNINIVAYSFGHRIVQQLDVGLQDKLVEAQLPESPLGCMRAVAIAPEAPPIDYGLIPQLCLTRGVDRLVTEYLREILFDDPTEPYPVRRIGRALCIGERSIDNWHRRILPCNEAGEKNIDFVSQREVKGHSFRVYSKPPIYIEYPSGEIYFSNSCLGAMFQSAALYMLTAPQKGFSFANAPFVSSLLSPKNGADAARTFRHWRVRLARSFRKIKRESAQFKPSWRSHAVALRINALSREPSPFSSNLG